MSRWSWGSRAGFLCKALSSRVRSKRQGLGSRQRKSICKGPEVSTRWGSVLVSTFCKAGGHVEEDGRGGLRRSVDTREAAVERGWRLG